MSSEDLFINSEEMHTNTQEGLHGGHHLLEQDTEKQTDIDGSDASHSIQEDQPVDLETINEVFEEEIKYV